MIRNRAHAEPLQQVFVSFALFGKGLLPKGVKVSQIKMDSKAFAKLMKDAAVMEGKLDLTRVDLCYAMCCNKVILRPPPAAEPISARDLDLTYLSALEASCVVYHIHIFFLPFRVKIFFGFTSSLSPFVQTSRRMNFEEFKDALSACAAARDVDAGAMRDAVARCQPELRGTIAAHVKWHDDRSTYTGVYAQVCLPSPPPVS